MHGLIQEYPHRYLYKFMNQVRYAGSCDIVYLDSLITGLTATLQLYVHNSLDVNPFCYCIVLETTQATIKALELLADLYPINCLIFNLQCTLKPHQIIKFIMLELPLINLFLWRLLTVQIYMPNYAH